MYQTNQEIIIAIKYFGTECCPQCKVLRPRAEEWCRKHNVQFEFYDADDGVNSDKLREYFIRSIPSVVVETEEKVLTLRGIDGWNEFEKEYEK